MSSRSICVIGLAGPSGVGKSTLARKIASELRSPVSPLCIDWFARPKWMPKLPTGEKNWDTPDGIDFATLRASLHHIVTEFATSSVVPKQLSICKLDVLRTNVTEPSLVDIVFVVVEGFLLFYDSALCKMFDIHLWLEADCETCLSRRRRRSKGRSRRQSAVEFADMYRREVWVHYQHYRAKQLANVPHVLHLDGMEPIGVLTAQAIAHIQAFALREKSRFDHPPTVATARRVSNRTRQRPRKFCRVHVHGPRR
eukprot:CAMPEP_0117472174 /NCGR_PEP_ID=MMETSP0784-20121206/8108_1 /TAXON_ID=39447 /ORGANISM="" /LENGTH=253 /DNA_ID=CAMNT_0005266311 /DNA_START=82 /DNA_END=840 /DNA_ORIENTATION=+